MTDQRLDRIYWALRIALGATAFTAGADKFTDLLTDWGKYLSPEMKDRLPVSTRDFMRIVGVIEMAVGGMILSGRTRVGGYVAAAWLAAIAGNLIAGQDWYDIAVRDLNMAVGAVALAKLTEARQARGIGVEDERELLHRAA